MRTLLTTHNLEVFKLFFNHKLHDIFREDLHIYVDKEDSKEWEDFIVNSPLVNNTHIYNETDLIKYYSNTYNSHLKTFKKVYFINMLLEQGIIDDGFYFTDDDVLLFGKIDEVKDYEHIMFDHEVSKMDTVFKEGWKIIDNYRIRHTGKINHNFSASNFFIPKNKIAILKEKSLFLFYEFIDILFNESAYIDKVCTKTRSVRKCSVLVFYLDALFLNVLFSNIFDGTERAADYKKPTYRHVRGVKEKLLTRNAKEIWKYTVNKNKSNWPKGQPLYHFVVTNKAPLMTEFFKAYNGEEPTYKNIDDLLLLNVKERSRITKEEYNKKFFGWPNYKDF